MTKEQGDEIRAHHIKVYAVPPDVQAWIETNPHCAARIAALVHGQNFFGCECDLHRSAVAEGFIRTDK